MFVYLRSEQPDGASRGLYTVGHYQPSGDWMAESDHETSEAAAARCAFLNGDIKTPDGQSYQCENNE